ncbi:hypothetical protein BD410DRAFT_493444 [Rickenella mellea]|uniref:Uncharacterized protein n=1 Tax=Rickenella mellea TaxID=50990 RepID=A0A4Y7PVM1_9AGAM|nr:hypothetical protein BD410DRAFT_493444 [Rickenella mellea]
MVIALPPQRAIIAIYVSTVIFVAQSIGASHIILNLRKYSSERPENIVSGINFAERRTIMGELSRQIVSDFVVDDTAVFAGSSSRTFYAVAID